MRDQLPAGISDDVVFALLVGLRQDGPKASGLLLVTVSESCVGDQTVRAVPAGVGDHRVGQEDGFELLKSLESISRQRPSFPFAVLASQSSQRSSDLCVVLDVIPEEVADSQKLPDFVHVRTRLDVADGPELVCPRQNPVVGEPETEITDVFVAKNTLI